MKRALEYVGANQGLLFAFGIPDITNALELLTKFVSVGISVTSFYFLYRDRAEAKRAKIEAERRAELENKKAE